MNEETKKLQPINGFDLIELGYNQNAIIGMALKINKKRNGYNREEMLYHYKNVLINPTAYLENELFASLATAIIVENEQPVSKLIPLLENSLHYPIYGKEGIEQGAIDQMNIAMKLPVAVAGALMPDAHSGYGLPIGGVLATRNAVIPYGVGVDIGCRMALSIFDLPETILVSEADWLKTVLIRNTCFGAGNGFQGKNRSEHSVLESETFKMNNLLKGLHEKAYTQLGSSGGGNHFVEFGIIEFQEKNEELTIEKGCYLALLSHSGSRGLGGTLANHYTRLAKEICELPFEARNLAYFNMNSQEGQEYWLAMTLAGEYASANHEIIHAKIAKTLGAKVLAKVENHHNFAWKEIHNGEELIVHRKGANPAGKGVMSIIPGSMATSGFLVCGKGETNSLRSSSHGAGRVMSRTKANQTVSNEMLQSFLIENGVTLIGGGTDEAPMAYKKIEEVILSQNELVDVLACFTPKIVRMADDGSKED